MSSLGGGEQIVIEDGKLGMGEGQENTAENDAKQESADVRGEKQQNLAVCPMCKGKGYYEEIAGTEQLHYVKKSDEQKQNQAVIMEASDVVTRARKLLRERSEKLSRENTSVKNKTTLSDSTAPTRPSRPRTRFPSVHVPRGPGKSEPARSQSQATGSAKAEKFPQVLNVLPVPARSDRQPQDTARLAAIKLDRKDWETTRSGLEDCLRLSRFHPEELEPHMGLVYRALSALLASNCLPRTTLFACQASRDFFVDMRAVCRPNFDELVCSLLQRTADSNRYVRLEANNALDKMVTYIPTVHAVRALVEKGPSHKNPLVRASAARLIACVVALRTPQTILSLPNLRDSCRKILETGALLMDDGNLDTREAAKKLMKRFVHLEDFDGVYKAEVDEKLRKRIDKPLVQLKYKEHLVRDGDY